MAPKRRNQHTEEHKRRVRKYYQSLGPDGKPPSQSQCIVFAANVLNIEIDQSQVSRQTSEKLVYLDAPLSFSFATTTTRRRYRDRPFEILEVALYEWMKKMEVTLAITGAIFKAKASQFFIRMEEYNGQEEPKWSNSWLENFQAKYGIAKNKKHGELGSAIAINCDEEIEAIQQ